MKNKKLLMCLLCFLITLKSYSQIYKYTGKAWSINTSLSPLSSIYDKVGNIQINNLSLSLGASKMIYKGIYPTIGYTYNKSTISRNTSQREYLSNTSYNRVDIHSINTSILIQKHLLTLQSKRINSVCFKQTMSIFFAPEFNYNITSSSNFQSKGDLSIKSGICIFNSYSGTRSRNIFWDIYYRKGLTPILTRIENENKQSLYKDEIGFQVRVLFRQRYDFSK
jgi:hypothetical protein